MTSGPHPLIDDLAWSFVSSHKEEPSRLIIHLAQALPVQPWGPLLDATRPPTDLPNCGELQFDGWRLSVQRIARSDLPADRREMSSWQAYLDADQVGHPVLARPAEGMRVAPLGMDGKTKSLGDLFTDAKIHPSLREELALADRYKRGANPLGMRSAIGPQRPHHRQYAARAGIEVEAAGVDLDARKCQTTGPLDHL